MADTEKFLPTHRAKLAEVDSLLRHMLSDAKGSEECTRRYFGMGGDQMVEWRRSGLVMLQDAWTNTRAKIVSNAWSVKTSLRLLGEMRRQMIAVIAQLDKERQQCLIERLHPTTPQVHSAGDELGDDWDEVGDDTPQPLEIQTGLFHGNAVAYCPQTGHIAIEPLRTQAAKLVRAGHIREGMSGDLVDALESLHVGDDLILEAADNVIGDDVIEVGRAKVAKKIAKVAKKTVKKTVKASKAVAKSRLGKVLKTAVSMSNPAAAVSMKALSKGASVAKKAKKKPKNEAAAKRQSKAKTTVKLATARNKGKASRSKTKSIAQAKGIAHSDVEQTTQALSVVDAAEAGDPNAIAALETHTQIESATETPLDPAQFADAEANSSHTPDGYTEPEDATLPDTQSAPSFFAEHSEAESVPDDDADDNQGAADPDDDQGDDGDGFGEADE